MNDPFDLPPEVLRRIPLFAELQKVLAWSGGPVNWDLARQVAASIASTEPRAPKPRDTDDLMQQVHVAELWLAEETGAPAPSHLAKVTAVSAEGWAERAPGAFAEILEPIAQKVGRAVDHPSIPPEAAQLVSAIGQVAPMLMGMQVGAIFGRVATGVLGNHDVVFPASDDEVPLVAPAIDGLATGYGLDPLAVRQVVALQAAAWRAEWESYTWTRPRFFALYHDYVSSLDLDVTQAFDRLRSLDLSDPQKLQESLGDGGLFSLEPSESTAIAAERVSSFLAVVQAHAGAAVQAAGRRAGDVSRVAEAIARGQAESAVEMLHGFVGIDAPDRRAAAGFVRATLERGGWALLNRIWEDPEAFPTPAELADPDAWFRRVPR